MVDDRPAPPSASDWAGSAAAGLIPVVMIGGLALGRERYLDRRYDRMPPFAAANRWAQDLHGQTIGLYGGFLAPKYPFAGNDLSNRVRYLAVPTDNGGFRPPANCGEWVDLLESERLGPRPGARETGRTSRAPPPGPVRSPTPSWSESSRWEAMEHSRSRCSASTRCRNDDVERTRVATPSSSGPTRSERIAAWVFGIYVAVALPLVVLRLGRYFWFLGDDWDFLTDRQAWSPGDLMRPHAEHLSTLPILATRLEWHLFGFRCWRYQFVVMAFHLTTAVLLRLVMRRSGVGPWGHVGGPRASCSSARATRTCCGASSSLG